MVEIRTVVNLAGVALLLLILFVAIPAAWGYSPQQAGYNPRVLQEMYTENNITAINYFNHSSPQYLEMLSVLDEYLEIYRR